MHALFHGSELSEVSEEGHLPLPVFLHDTDASELLVMRHEAEPCLVGCSRDHLVVLAEHGERRRAAEEALGKDPAEHHRRMRRTFGLVARIERSDTGLRISPAMRHLGRIERLALLVGAGASFEIWNPELALASSDEQFRDLAAFSLKTRDAEGVH